MRTVLYKCLRAATVALLVLSTIVSVAVPPPPAPSAAAPGQSSLCDGIVSIAVVPEPFRTDGKWEKSHRAAAMAPPSFNGDPCFPAGSAEEVSVLEVVTLRSHFVYTQTTSSHL